MRLLLPAALVFFAGAAFAQAAPDTGAEALRLVESHAITFTAPAKNIPTNKMADGPLLGNGDLGVTLAGTPDALRFYIGKNDFWGQKTQSPQTVGRIELLMPTLAGAPYKATGDMRRATWCGEFAKEGVALKLRAFVDANAGRLLIEIKNTGDKPVPFTLRSVRGENAPVSGLSFLHAPDGEAAGMRRVGLAARILETDTAATTLAPGATARVAVAVLSDLDAKNPLAEAESQASAMTPEKFVNAVTAHEAWWDAFWKKSFVEIPDKVIEQHWYSAQYILGSCSRAGKVAPGLWGNWITQDKTAWHGDFHLNYNFQAPYYSCWSSNRAEIALPFYDAMNESIPRGLSIAKRRGWKGIHFPVSIGPWGMCPEGDDADWGQRSNAVYAALLYSNHWRATRDKDWLVKTGYPYMREVEKFWTDYLKFRDDRYVIEHDAIHEATGGAGRSGVSADFNPIFSLGAMRTLYRDMLDMSEALGTDAELRPKWRDILAKISAFPTQEKNGKTVFRYTEKGTAWWGDNTVGIQHIYPAGAIGLDSDPKLLKISRNMLEAMGRWQDNNGSSSWYAACARVGYAPEKCLVELRRMYDRKSMPNKIPNFGGGGIENVSPAAAVNEMLLQSHEGVLRFFPSWPKERDARFGTLRADGAFLVSAALKSGVVSGVSILSEKGRDCVVSNPWPGKKVKISRNGVAAETVSGERFTLKTKENETLALRPE